MIKPSDYRNFKKLYLREGKVWKVLGYCPEPSIVMKCTSTGERCTFGIGGTLNEEFKEIKMEDLNVYN